MSTRWTFLLFGCAVALSSGMALAGSGVSFANTYSGFDEQLPIKQDACSASPYHTQDVDRVKVNSHYPSIVVEIERDVVSCGTELAAWLRRTPDAYQVVFRPRNMDATSVGRCNCLISARTLLSDVPQGPVNVQVYKQEGFGSQPSQPKLLRSVTLRHVD